MAGISNAELLARGATALLVEIVRQSDDVVAPGEVRDLAEALAVLAPLVSPPIPALDAVV